MIKIKNITKCYGKDEILKDANYIFPQKGLVCLLGPSGCGKSTLFNLIAGFDTEYKGKIYIKDSVLSNSHSDKLCNYRRDYVGFIFQDYHILTGYTVLENILLPCDLEYTSKTESINKASELLARLNIDIKKNEKIENLSGGQKQRVSIARALMKNPTILLADEPTGALDRTTSNEIMELLKSISQDMLVVVITHDKKICSFADEIIGIEDKKIIKIKSKIDDKECEKNIENIKDNKNIKKRKLKIDLKNRAKKNFKIYIKQFIIVAMAIALGISSFILSKASENIMKSSIEKFKIKNTAFNNGYIEYSDDKKDVLDLLSKDERVKDAYYQYKLENILLSFNDKEKISLEYIPMPKSSESLSYGVMPRSGKYEIAITPSLAKKLNDNIKDLVGKTITLEIGEYKKDLTISGIYNSGYESVFVSSDIEKTIYEEVEHEKNIHSVTYDVKNFEDVVTVNDMLIKKNIKSINASKEINNLVTTFNNINKLFLIVSIIIFLVGLFLSVVLLWKLQNSRIREIGLLSALGFNKKQIKNIMLTENIILATISTAMTLCVALGTTLLSRVLKTPIELNFLQVLYSAILTFLMVGAISGLISNKLVKIEPAKALRM